MYNKIEHSKLCSTWNCETVKSSQLLPWSSTRCKSYNAMWSSSNLWQIFLSWSSDSSFFISRHTDLITACCFSLALAASTMARVFSVSGRRLWLPVGLILFLIVWVRKTHTDIPRWNVIDFQIKDYKSKEDPYSDSDQADAFPRENSYHSQNDYRADIEAIRKRPYFQQQQLSYDQLQDRIQEFIQWDRPSTDHWPAWHDYDSADYG